MVAELLGMQRGPLQFCSSNNMSSLVQCSFSCVLDIKFCLHAAGGIYVNVNFTHSGGRVDISGSSAKYDGGALLRSSSGTANWLNSTLDVFVVVPVPYVSREHGGCLRDWGSKPNASRGSKPNAQC